MFFFGFDATFNLKSKKQQKLEIEYENNLRAIRTKIFETLGNTDQYFLF